MNLNVSQVVQLWEHVKFGPHNLIQAPRTYGEARYVIPSCDLQVLHARRVSWGPGRRWAQDYQDRLDYERVEISHPEFYVELEAPYSTLMYYCAQPHRRHMSSYICAYRYDLDHCGDLQYLSDALMYFDLIQE